MPTKYLVIRCDDEAPAGRSVAALLEGAKASFLQHLAQTRAAGLIHSGPRSAHAAPLDRFGFYRELFGLAPDAREAAPGQCYLASVQMQLAPDETAWCCDFVTRQGEAIIDPTAGGIPTKESELLIHALDEQLGSETQRWEIGQDAHHLLIVSNHALSRIGEPGPPSPALLAGSPWNRSLPKGVAGEAFRALIESASGVLESHVVNRVRVDLGENPANMIWLWGGAGPGTPQRAVEPAGRSGVLLSNSFILRGLARVLGLDWQPGAGALDEPAILELRQRTEALIDRHDTVHVHVPVRAEDPVERQCAIERIDQLLLKPLMDRLSRFEPWRLAVIIDDRRLERSIPFVAAGTDVPPSAVSPLTPQALQAAPLSFADGTAWSSWFIRAAEPSREPAQAPAPIMPAAGPSTHSA